MGLQKTELSEADLHTYSRQIVLKEIGYEGQRNLRNAKVCVVGLGGLGCPTVQQLTAIGVGYLRIVDRDVVDRSNLHRQYLYDTSQLGLPKVEAALQKLEKLNPDVELDPQPLSVDYSNAERIIEGMDVVVDGLDRIKPRYAVNQACAEQGIPYVFGAAIETFGSVSTIVPKETACFECFYSDIDDSLLPTCSVVGVHPSVTTIISSLEVSEAVRILVNNTPKLAGSLLFFDLESLQLDLINLKRRADCNVCGENRIRVEESRQDIEIEEVCSRGGRRTFIVTPSKDLDLDLSSTRQILRRRMQVEPKQTRLSLMFGLGGDVEITLLRTGICILEGRMEKDSAVTEYRWLMSNIQPGLIDE